MKTATARLLQRTRLGRGVQGAWPRLPRHYLHPKTGCRQNRLVASAPRVPAPAPACPAPHNRQKLQAQTGIEAKLRRPMQATAWQLREGSTCSIFHCWSRSSAIWSCVTSTSLARSTIRSKKARLESGKNFGSSLSSSKAVCVCSKNQLLRKPDTRNKLPPSRTAGAKVGQDAPEPS